MKKKTKIEIYRVSNKSILTNEECEYLLVDIDLGVWEIKKGFVMRRFDIEARVIKCKILK